MRLLTIAYLITQSIIAGCSSEPALVETPPPSPVINGTLDVEHPNYNSAASFLVAENAYLDNGRLFIRFNNNTEALTGYTLLPEAGNNTGAGSSTTIPLQQVVNRFNRLPLAQLSSVDPDQWSEQTRRLKPLPIAGVALWHEFRDRIIASVTPEDPSAGIVVEFLKQDELFYYFDQQGLLHSIELHDKPADLRIRDTYKLSELITRVTPFLYEYIVAAGGGDIPALVFNTGDTAEHGYPFIYANHEHGQVVFLQRTPEPEHCCQANGTMLPAGLVHTGRSHVETFLRQPIGSVARLFTLVSHKVFDTLTPKPVFVLGSRPITPVAANAPMASAAWERELDALSDSPVSQGSIEYLVDGDDFFPRLFHAIQSAQESVDIRTYIFDNDDYALKIANLLKRRSNEIKVRVLLDGLGTITAASATSVSMPDGNGKGPKIVRYLEADSAIQVRTGLNPWLTGDHTKTILIDGRVAYLGGMNIGREYRYDWHDLMTELRGPIVDEIQSKFEKAWIQQSFLGDIRAALYRRGAPVNQAQPGQVPIRLLVTRPGDSQILRTQLAAIARARQRIYIQNAYFTSDDILFELAQARRRGVDVRVIIPHQSDSGIIDRSNVRAINAMLDHGIRVYIYPGESHIKGAVYDGWICLGSANFDQLSLRMNKELNIATSDPAAVQGFLDEVMVPDFDKSVELKEQLPKKWSDFLMEAIADQL